MAPGRNPTYYTSRELKEIQKLVAQGFTAKEIAERLGNRHSEGSVTSTIYRQKMRGTKEWKNREQATLAETLEERRQRMIRMMEHGGLTLKEIARVFGVSTPAILSAMEREGLDSEMRQEILKAFPVCKSRKYQLAAARIEEQMARKENA